MKKYHQSPNKQYRQLTWSILGILVLAACSQSVKKSEKIIQPDYTAPVTVLLDSRPAPKTVRIDSIDASIKFGINTSRDGSFSIQNLGNRDSIFGFSIEDFAAPTVNEVLAPKASFTNFDTEQGLTLSTIICSMKDSNGNLWFGTQGGGISRYNGLGFTNYTVAEGLVHNNVRGIVEAPDSTIWIGTDAGLSRYDGRSFQNFTEDQGYAYGAVRAMIIDKKGMIWLGTLGDGLVYFDPSGDKSGRIIFENLSTPYRGNNTIRAIMEDKEGNIWFSGDNGIIRFNPTKGDSDHERFKQYTTDRGLATNRSRAMYADSKGNLWIGAWGGGLCLYEPEKDKLGDKCFTTWKKNEGGLTSDFIRCFFEDRQGNLWFGSWGGGMQRMNVDQPGKEEKIFTNYSTQNGLAHDNVMCISEDNNGNLWIGTLGGGISRFNGQSIITYKLTDGLLLDRVKSMAEDQQGNLWIAAEDGGFSRFDGNTYINYKILKSGIFGNNIFSIFPDQEGGIWLGSYGSAMHFKPEPYSSGGGEISIYRLGSSFGFPSSINQDNDGNIWFGQRDEGITIFDGASFTTFTSVQGLVNDQVNFITADQNNNIWISTSGGVSKFDGKSFKNFTAAQGLSHSNVICSMEDQQGNIWFGTEGGGISRYDGTSFMNITTVEGLPDNMVRGLKMDENGLIWIGSNQGLSSLKFRKTHSDNGNGDDVAAGAISLINEELKAYEPIFEVFNINTGYPIKDMWTNSMVLSKVGLPKGDKRDVGVIWGGYGDEKVIRFDPNAVRKSTDAPRVSLLSIKIKNETIPWYSLANVEMDSLAKFQQEVMTFGRSLLPNERDHIYNNFGDLQFDGITKFNPIPDNLVLPYKHNQLTFEYGAIETGKPQLVRYQYMLEGYEQEWSPVTAEASATFGNMFEGKYTFKVKAMSPDGLWSLPVQFHFRVLPPWWRSWWAYVIYTIILAIGARVVHLFQKKRVIRLEKEKAQRRELEQGKEMKKAYDQLELAHSNLKSTQSQLIQSEKMASLGELTAGIAHEIQNPLNFVNNFSEVTEELAEELEEEGNKRTEERDTGLEKELIADIKENLKKIHHHGLRASGIVKGMLEHSRTGDGVKEPTDINALADEYLRLAYHGLRAKDKSFNADFKTEFDETLPKINVIPQDIGRVLLNLINNAFFAVNQKAARHSDPEQSEGEGSGAVENEYKPEVTVSTKMQDNSIEISVKDNGPGIPIEIKDKIFQPFFTTKPTGSGTGLGLSLSYDIVKAHGGTISVESQSAGEAGTEFIIQLPS